MCSSIKPHPIFCSIDHNVSYSRLTCLNLFKFEIRLRIGKLFSPIYIGLSQMSLFTCHYISLLYYRQPWELENNYVCCNHKHSHFVPYVVIFSVSFGEGHNHRVINRLQCVMLKAILVGRFLSQLTREQNNAI